MPYKIIFRNNMPMDMTVPKKLLTIYSMYS